MMGVVEELKKTQKGQLQYTRNLNSDNVQRLTEELSAPPKLRVYHPESPTKLKSEQIVYSLQPDSQEKGDETSEECNDCTKSPDMSPVKIAKKTKDHSPSENISIKTVTSPVVSPEYGRTSLQIRNYEVMWDNKAKTSIEAKICEFERNEQELQTLIVQRALQLEERQAEEMRRLYEQTAKMQLREKAETSKRIQQMRDSHRTRKKLQDDKLLEGERKKQQLQEEERRRNEIEKRQAILQSMFQHIRAVHDECVALYEGCQHKKHIPESPQKPWEIIKSIKAKAQSLLQHVEPSPEDLQQIRALLDYAKNVLECMKTTIDVAVKTGKVEEEKLRQQQQEQERAAAEAQKSQASASASVTAAAPTSGGTTPASAPESRKTVIEEVVTEFEHYKQKLDQMRQSLKAFMDNTQMKKYRFELQKAVNTPINAISPVDGAHLRDKLQKLIHLLGGHQLDGKHLSAKDAPEGIQFCKNLIARMIVRKGEEQVSSKHESAFAIAMVAAGLWFEHNDIGDLMLAYFHEFCPYIVPLYIPKDSSMSSEQYHKMLGYKVDEDGTIESQDKFLKRMSGIMRLYASLLVSSPPRANCIHPHGIDHAWTWFARTLNLEPQPDITATLTYDMLQVTGNALYTNYKLQFVKLLFALLRDFMPKVKAVAVAGGPVARLELYLDETLQNLGKKKIMSVPGGFLSQSFWFT